MPFPSLDAARAVHTALARLGIRHVLVGAVAAQAHGAALAPTSVDLIVGPEAFVEDGALLVARAGLPFSADGLPVRFLPVPAACESAFAEILATSCDTSELPVLGAEALALYALAQGDRRDERAAVAVLRAAPGREASARVYVARNAPALLPAFNALLTPPA